MFRNLKEAGRRITEPGLHHFRTDDHRIHLRTEEDGSGLLTIDASRVVHLNPVAADMAWLKLSGFARKEAVAALRKRYRVRRKQAAKDLSQFEEMFEKMLSGGGAEPVSYVNMEVTEPFQREVSAPYRMDLALTYRCNVNCSHCYNQTREKGELTTEEWKEALVKIRDLGIPHVIFTGGEATLRDDLPELIAHAETLGLVTGLLTNGVRLADGDYLRELMDAGLDHVQITLESADEKVHNAMTGAESFRSTVQGIKNCVQEGIHTITNTTITVRNAQGMTDTIRFASDLGLKSVAANAVIQSGKALEGDFALPLERLEPVILAMNEELDRLGMRFIWYSPTRYCAFNPLEFDLGEKRCTAGEYNLCIEPDGEVLPCQSWYESAGNFLRDPWRDIWESELLKAARNRDWVDESCRECVHFTLCGGGCPLEKEKGAACRDST